MPGPGWVRFYRTAEDFRRYTGADPGRRRALRRFLRTYRRYLAGPVLDLACGGGVLGLLLGRGGRGYLGVDANPDMIREARAWAGREGGAQRFVRADVTRLRLPGRFGAVTLLGNALGHLSVLQMVALLRGLRRNVRPGTTFLLDYRDVVGMFWRGTWGRVHVQSHKRGRVVSRTLRVETTTGQIRVLARSTAQGWRVRVDQAIWSPYILEAIMAGAGWHLVRRDPGLAPGSDRRGPERWVEVYRYRGAPRGPRGARGARAPGRRHRGTAPASF